jgi:formate C-acetyltransferase
MNRIIDAEAIMDNVEAVELTERARRMREYYFTCPVRVATERAQIAVEAWQETEGQPVELRRARLLQWVLQRVPVVIHPGELLVGSETRFFRGVYPPVDHDPKIVLDHLDSGVMTIASDAHVAAFTEEDLQIMAEAARFFQGKTGTDLVRELRNRLWGTWWDDFLEVSGSLPYEHHPIVSGAVLYETVLAKGLDGIMQEARTRLEAFANHGNGVDDPEHLCFWESVIISCQALVDFAHRYAELARAMAASETDPVRREELERAAEVCTRVPQHPARTFHEALQAIRFLALGVKLEGGWHPALGRLDHILYPYFMQDLEEGRLQLEEAVDLLADLFTYAARDNYMYSLKDAQNGQMSSTIINLTLGGVSRQGEDVCNELTYVILHLAGLLRYAQPQLTFRLGQKTPRWALHKALETNRRIGGGIPQFHNDDHIVAYLEGLGVPVEAARDWAANGCSQPFPATHRCYFRPAMKLNMPLALDLALHNGIASRSGKRIGLETGASQNFRTFDDLMTAFRQQYEFILRRTLRQTRFAHQAEAQRWRMPFLSILLPGCLENGKDFMLGGQGSHLAWYAKDRGIIDTADSLTAIQQLVYKEKRLTMDALLEALDGDFQGPSGEEVQRLCLAAPKYGNEDPEADGMVRELGKWSASLIVSERHAFGEPYAINRNGVGWHYYAGKGVGALPNGRMTTEALTDGSLSPTQGRDRCGPTAVLNSALAADFKEAAVSILNLKFPVTMVQSPEALDKLTALTQTFQRNGGTHIQYNFLDNAVLLDAKAHPEKYPDLIVRVAGYSAYFVQLAPEVQDEIIRRSAQPMV